ncbi:universal stress protein [Pararhodospirillum photometricum]|nr:universal stress protein [Pararhodospirillum photometricum]
MTPRHLFVHLDSSAVCGRRVGVTLALARRFDAHVSALFAQIDGVVPTYGLPEGLPKTTTHTGAHALERFGQQARAAEVRFEAHLAPPGTAADVVKHTLEGARDSDLAILGQFLESQSGGEVPADLVGQVVAHCGRPALVIPGHGAFETLGRRVLVGWNGTREAARAVNDAIPLMRAAESVYLLSIAPPADMSLDLETLSGGLVRHLLRHGITATPVREPRHGLSIADTLVSRVTDYGCDLLVLGAYGHQGLHAMVRTGVTRPLISQMTVPTLLSH